MLGNHTIPKQIRTAGLKNIGKMTGFHRGECRDVPYCNWAIVSDGEGTRHHHSEQGTSRKLETEVKSHDWKEIAKYPRTS